MKKIIAAVLALCIIAGVTVMSYAESIYGDVDKNGKVNSSDALVILRYSVGLEKSIDTKLADINHDGKVNSSDALLALQISIGMVQPETVKSSTTKTTTAAPKKLTDIPSSLGKVVKQFAAPKVTGLTIQLGRIELSKSVTQKFDKTINSQIANAKTITYKPACSVAIIDCDTPTRLNITKGTTQNNTEAIAKSAGAIIAINGRGSYPTKSFATIRSGAVYKAYEGTEGKAGKVLVMYRDGTWKHISLDNTTAAAEIKKGAYNTCGYQDITIQNGKATFAYTDTTYRNRTYLARVSANRYIFMVTEFMPISDAAKILLAYGVTDAIQINGGNCTQMYVKDIGNTTGSTGASIKPLNKVGKLETEWFADYNMYSDNRKGGPCSHEMDDIYFK